jgi:Uma2 family endonuclease
MTALKVTETEYWEKYYNSETNYEWNNGYLEEKQESNHLTYLMYKWFLKLLDHFLEVHPIADFTGLEMGFRLALSDKIDIRKPDLGVVLNDNPVPLLLSDRSYKGIFDLCIEALSDSSPKEIERDTVNKKAEYAAAGVKEYYILYNDTDLMEFYRLNDNGVYIPIERVDNDIIQSTVLPGFQFRISDLYNTPSIDEMINDPVYQGFILPSYQQEKIIRIKAEQLAKKAEQLAKTEAKRTQDTEKLLQQAQAEIVSLKQLLASKE